MKATFNPLTDLGIEFRMPEMEEGFDNHPEQRQFYRVAEVKTSNGFVMKLKSHLWHRHPELPPHDADYEIYAPSGKEFGYGGHIHSVEEFRTTLEWINDLEYTYMGKATITRPDGRVEEKEFYMWADRYDRENCSVEASIVRH